MSLDTDKLGAKIKSRAQSREDKAYERTSSVADKFFYRVTLDENDSVAEAVEFLLGIKPGGLDKAKEVLGISSDTTTEGPAALPAPKEAGKSSLNDFWPVYEADGTSRATDIDHVLKDDVDAVRNHGLVPHVVDGNQVGLKKRPVPPTPPTPMPAPPTVDLDREVPIRDKKGKDTRQRISIREGNADSGLEAVLDNDLTVVAFKEKPRVAVRRSS